MPSGTVMIQRRLVDVHMVLVIEAGCAEEGLEPQAEHVEGW